MTKLPAIPSLTHSDATLNFQKIQKLLIQRENSAAMFYRKAAQKIKSGETLVKVDTVIKDPGSHFDSEVGYKVSVEGYYHVDGQISFLNAAEKPYAAALIFVNGSLALEGTRQVVSTEAAIYSSSVSGVLFLKAGEVIELYAYQNVAAEKALEVGAQANRLNVFQVAS